MGFPVPRLAEKHQEKATIMHIQSLQQSPSFAVELHQAASGRLGQIEARQVATPSEAQQLAQRQDAPKGEGLLARLGAALVRPFVAIMDWLGKLLGSHARTGPQPSQDAQPAVMSSAVVFKQMVLQQELPMTLKGLDKASELATLTPEGLAREHSRLASGDGALRSLSTALAGIRAGSQVEESRIQAGRLLERSIGGIALQQWGTTGGAASQLVLDASPELRREITDHLHQVMSEVALLRQAVESEVSRVSADKALADGLVKRFGADAEKYLGRQPGGIHSDAEVMALGLYTGIHYADLNRALRQGQELDAGQKLIDQGMSAAFEKSGQAEQVVKTFRGTRGGDAFNAVEEGKVGHDDGYLSTSLNPGVARSFGQGTISTVFGRSGIDVSGISNYKNEKEILYNKETDMRVLLSASDEQGVTRRVLEEAALGEQSGHSQGLLDALDLASKPERSGEVQEQDVRLRMRGLDLA